MLDAISDFWKPAKKNQPADKLNPAELQVGTSIGFGFVPQASLSGRRLQVVGINTYRFGEDEEPLTSFVLSPEKDVASPASISMIVADDGDQQYLCISRRISIGDRMKMFDSIELENAIDKTDFTKLSCKDGNSDFKGWTVASYNRKQHGIVGQIFKGDFRKSKVPDSKEAQEFTYALLLSDSEENAIEIEKYKDGRVEVYASVYRLISDIGEVTQPTRTDLLSRPDLKLASKPEEVKVEEKKEEVKAAAPFVAAPVVPKQEEKPAVKAEITPEVKAEPVKSEPVKLQEFPKTQVAQPLEVEKPKPVVQAAAAPTSTAQPATPKSQEEKKPMAMNEPVMNGAMGDKTPSLVRNESAKQESKTVNKIVNGIDNDALECDLRVANRIIDEAIRSEMRLSDVVRRIIELPVSHQEAVQLPITLSDEDYALLAIRYGVSPSDRNAIKTRIIEDLGSFSGKKAA
ncbi:MAG: hypothetical protein ACK502_07720 [Alphaproteobacteria bacterium]